MFSQIERNSLQALAIALKFSKSPTEVNQLLIRYTDVKAREYLNLLWRMMVVLESASP